MEPKLLNKLADAVSCCPSVASYAASSDNLVALNSSRDSICKLEVRLMNS